MAISGETQSKASGTAVSFNACAGECCWARSKRPAGPHCPFLRQAPIIIRDLPEDTERARRLKEDLAAARTELNAAPEHFTLANWGACNLRCVMCDSRSNTPLPRHVLKTQENLKHYYGQEITLMLTGNGDPLARKDTRELLMNFPAERYPGVSFEILTNGLLWDPAGLGEGQTLPVQQDQHLGGRRHARNL